MCLLSLAIIIIIGMNLEYWEMNGKIKGKEESQEGRSNSAFQNVCTTFSGTEYLALEKSTFKTTERGYRCPLSSLFEIPNLKKETQVLLDLLPDRIGHGTFLKSSEGGSLDLVDFVRKHQIPLGKAQGFRSFRQPCAPSTPNPHIATQMQRSFVLNI